jgi:DNA-nicking Smr family endonuclease
VRAEPDVEDLRLWTVVAATVRPLRPAPRPLAPRLPAPTPPAPAMTPVKLRVVAHPHPAPALKPKGPRPPPADIEPGRHYRLARGRDLLAARIDLHGLTHDQARAALTAFIVRSVAQDWRAVLVITGKGAQGDGVLKRCVPDWLAAAPVRQHVAGVSEAHRRHGGEGALYVALKRRG